jgi:hypothetical protein
MKIEGPIALGDWRLVCEIGGHGGCLLGCSGGVRR